MVPHSKLKLEIVRILKDEGYIANYAVRDSGSFQNIEVFLKYTSKRQTPLHLLQRVSRPGCRVYVGKDEIPSVLGGLGINILSTSRGVMTGHRARQLSVGGEILCVVN